MASSDAIAALRRLIDEPDATLYTDMVLSTRIDGAAGDIRTVAAEIWREKAASYASLVDITEAGSSRKNSQLYVNAIAMAKSYEEEAAADVAIAEYSTTRAIRRA